MRWGRVSPLVWNGSCGLKTQVNRPSAQISEAAGEANFDQPPDPSDLSKRSSLFQTWVLPQAGQVSV